MEDVMDDGPLVLLIGGHLKTLQLARRLGLRVLFIQHPRRFEPPMAELVENLILADYTDWDTLRPLAEAAHEVWKFSSVLSLSEPGLLPAARVNALLGLNGTPLAVVQRLRNKAMMRQWLDEVGAPSLQAAQLTAEASLVEFGAQAGYPFVVKPIDGAAGYGVLTVAAAEDVHDVWRQVETLRSVPAIADGLYKVHEFLMEEYAAGPEFSVETFSFAGRHVVVAITEKLVDEASRAELGHAMPARLDAARAGAVESAVAAFLDAVGLMDGPAHTELRISPEGPRIIESHNRVGGGFIHDLVRATYGIDLEELALAWAVGQGDELPDGLSAQCGGAVRFVHAPPGTVTGVGDLEGVRANPAVITAGLTIAAGDTVHPLANNWDRLGHVVVTGVDTAAAIASCDHLVELLRPTVRADSPNAQSRKVTR
jgi:biotin carboxylase